MIGKPRAMEGAHSHVQSRYPQASRRATRFLRNFPDTNCGLPEAPIRPTLPAHPAMPTHLTTGLSRTLRELGADLAHSLNATLAALPEGGLGPQRLGAAVKMDKVFAHRLLKCVRQPDPLAVLLHAPGPEPLLRFLRAAKKRGVDAPTIAAGEAAVARFRTVLREDVGDRSQLDAILSTWVPEARAEFELRRCQAIFKAQSQLQGVSAETNFSAVFLHPSHGSDRIDVVWTAGLYGLQRWRPGAVTKISTRRFILDGEDRRPTTLEGERVEGLDGLRLDQFCQAPPAALEVKRIGDVLHYVLAGPELGRKERRDLFLAEVNVAELPLTPRPGRRPYVFAEVSTPTKRLIFDVFVHASLWQGFSPELGIYDTTFDGVVDVNDPTRAIDRLDTTAALTVLPPTPSAQPHADVPHHREMMEHVHQSLGWDPEAFRGWRAAIDYPLYGTQVAVSFTPPA